MTDFWQGRTADVRSVLRKLNKQEDILHRHGFHLLGLFIQNIYTSQRAAGVSEGWSASAASYRGGQGQRVWAGINKAVTGLGVGGEIEIIQIRSSVSKYWLWKQTLIHIQIIRPRQRAVFLETPAVNWRKHRVRHSKWFKIYSVHSQSCINIVWGTEIHKHSKKTMSDCPGLFFKTPELCTSSRKPFFPCNWPRSE